MLGGKIGQLFREKRWEVLQRLIAISGFEKSDAHLK